jgi:hypothetical protein
MVQWNTLCTPLLLTTSLACMSLRHRLEAHLGPVGERPPPAASAAAIFRAAASTAAALFCAAVCGTYVGAPCTSGATLF